RVVRRKQPARRGQDQQDGDHNEADEGGAAAPHGAHAHPAPPITRSAIGLRDGVGHVPFAFWWGGRRYGLHTEGVFFDFRLRRTEGKRVFHFRLRRTEGKRVFHFRLRRTEGKRVFHFRLRRGS